MILPIPTEETFRLGEGADVQRCPQCGREFARGRFCTSCGTALQTARSAGASPVKPTSHSDATANRDAGVRSGSARPARRITGSKRKRFALAGVASAVLLLAVVGWRLHGDGPDSHDAVAVASPTPVVSESAPTPTEEQGEPSRTAFYGLTAEEVFDDLQCDSGKTLGRDSVRCVQDGSRYEIYIYASKRAQDEAMEHYPETGNSGVRVLCEGLLIYADSHESALRMADYVAGGKVI